jgi:hypothetical protein
MVLFSILDKAYPRFSPRFSGFQGSLISSRFVSRRFYYLDEIFTDLKSKGVDMSKRYAV